jgi:DNA-binding NarL/FixJ family response regulator
MIRAARRWAVRHRPRTKLNQTTGTRRMNGEPASRGKMVRERIRVIVAHADPATRRAVRDVLSDVSDFVVVADAADGVTAVELALFYRPEIVLLDVTMPRRDGIAAAALIVAGAPSVSVVMFSDRDESATAMAALRAGACGFLSAVLDLRTLAESLRSVMAGGAAVSASLARHLVDLVREAPETTGVGLRPVRSSLTRREWEVLDMICAGMSTREISSALFVAEDTVYGHVKHMMRKLGVKSRAEAVSVAGTLRQIADGA